MKKISVSQEGLKLIASITMLIDHIGVVLVYSMYDFAMRGGNYALAAEMAALYMPLRIIGRIAFPIYCFLLVEGFHHTRNLKRYIGRLAVGMVLSELPFDLCFSGSLDWTSCSVMVTLLLGSLMIAAMERVNLPWKIALILPFYLLAEWLDTDYGGNGIAIIAMLAITRGLPRETLVRDIAFVILLWFGLTVDIGPFEIPVEAFGLVSLIFLHGYNGRKLTCSKWVQWTFYLFYPAHLFILWLIKQLIIG